MNWFKSIAAAAALQAAFFGAAHAGDNLNAVKSAGVLKIGTEGTYAPFTYHDTSGKLVGFDVEIGEAVAGKIGVKAWICRGEIYGKRDLSPNVGLSGQSKGKPGMGDKRRERGRGRDRDRDRDRDRERA